jgi:hypothetical protein
MPPDIVEPNGDIVLMAPRAFRAARLSEQISIFSTCHANMIMTTVNLAMTWDVFMYRPPSINMVGIIKVNILQFVTPW